MDENYEKQLEARIELELKGLPDLHAPATLRSKVMLRLERSAELAWYRRPLQDWPIGWQAACLTLFLGTVAVLCLGLWALPQTPEFTLLAHQATGWLGSLEMICNVLALVGNALIVAAKGMGTIFLVSLLAAGALGWGACLGLGTMAVRLALARR